MSMPDFNGIGTAFVQHYYGICNDPMRKDEIGGLYHDCALLTYEGDQKQGKQAILERKRALPPVAHDITSMDCQPVFGRPGAPDSFCGILIMVIGQVKTEGQERAIGFTQMFNLCSDKGSYFISNEVFRLNLHNG